MNDLDFSFHSIDLSFQGKVRVLRVGPRRPSNSSDQKINLLMPGWGCGEASSYIDFGEALAERTGEVVFIPEFNGNTVRPYLHPAPDPAGYHSIQASKLQALAGLLQYFSRLQPVRVIGYSEGAMHAVCAIESSEGLSPVELRLICPGGLGPPVSTAKVTGMLLRNGLHNLVSHFRATTAERIRLHRHRKSVKRYRTEYADNPHEEHNFIDVRSRLSSLIARGQVTSAHIVACLDDAMIELPPLQELAGRRGMTLSVIPGRHNQIFMDPEAVAAAVL